MRTREEIWASYDTPYNKSRELDELDKLEREVALVNPPGPRKATADGAALLKSQLASLDEAWKAQRDFEGAAQKASDEWTGMREKIARFIGSMDTANPEHLMSYLGMNARYDQVSLTMSTAPERKKANVRETTRRLVELVDEAGRMGLLNTFDGTARACAYPGHSLESRVTDAKALVAELTQGL